MAARTGMSNASSTAFAPIAPVVSVIIATYKRQALLPRAIESVIAQTFQDWELIVVDDEPSSETRAIVAGFADPRIRYHAHPVNAGLCAARNTGIRAARGRYIAFLDDDDAYLPEKLELQVRALDAVPERVGVVACFEEVLRNDGRATVRAMHLDGDVHAKILVDDLIRMQPLMVRRSCFDVVGVFDEDLRAHDDFDMTLRLSRHYEFVTIPRPLVRIHPTVGSMSQNVQRRIEAIDTIMAKHPEFRSDRRVRARWLRRLARHHAELGDRRGWRRHMLRSLRADPINANAWLVLLVGLVFGAGAHRTLGKWRGRMAALIRAVPAR